MSTDQKFIDHLQTRSGLGSALSFRKMFGEYALYLDGKVVGFACDNQLYLKPTEPGRAAIGNVSEHPPYPGAKPHFRIDEQFEDRELLQRIFRVTAQALPKAKPKPLPKQKPAAAAAGSSTSGKRG